MDEVQHRPPVVVGLADVPVVPRCVYSEVIAQLPKGRALVLEFETERDLRAGQAALSAIARHCLGPGQVRTKRAKVNWSGNGRPRLFVWRMRSAEQLAEVVRVREVG